MNVREMLTGWRPAAGRRRCRRRHCRRPAALARRHRDRRRRRLSSSPAFRTHLGAFDQPIGAVHHDAVAVGDAADDVARRLGRPADLHHLDVHARAVVHDVHERALLAVLDCDVRDDELIGQRIHQQVHVHELLGEQRVILVVEHRLQPRRARRAVDLVVHREERARRDLLRVVAVERLHRQMRALPQLLRDLRQRILRNREQHRDRLQLGDHHHARRVAGVDDVPGVHQAQARDTRDRGGDLRVDELQLRVVDVGGVLLGGRFVLRDQRDLRVELLLRHGVGLDQLAVAIDVHLGVAEQRLVVRERGFREFELNLIRSRVDLGEHLAFLDVVAFLEVHLHELAVDARLERHRVERRHVAEAVQHDRDARTSDGRDDDRHRSAARVRPGHRGRRRPVATAAAPGHPGPRHSGPPGKLAASSAGPARQTAYPATPTIAMSRTNQISPRVLDGAYAGRRRARRHSTC